MRNLLDALQTMRRDWLFWVVLAFAIIFLIALAPRSHAQTEAWPEYDIWGYRYPKDCRRDLSHVPAVIQSNVDLGYSKEGLKTAGYFTPSKNMETELPLIQIDRIIRDPKVWAAVLHHERCHALMWYLTGNYRWHKE